MEEGGEWSDSVEAVETLLQRHEQFEKMLSSHQDRFDAIKRITLVGECLGGGVWGGVFGGLFSIGGFVGFVLLGDFFGFVLLGVLWGFFCSVGLLLWRRVVL